MKLLLKLEACSMETDPSFTGSVACEEFPFIIGRGKDSHWQIQDARKIISKKHCCITFEAGEFLLQDLSTNGTTLNKTFVKKNVANVLQNGHLLGLGDYVFKVHVKNVADFLPPPPSEAPSEEYFKTASEPEAVNISAILADITPSGMADQSLLQQEKDNALFDTIQPRDASEKHVEIKMGWETAPEIKADILQGDRSVSGSHLTQQIEHHITPNSLIDLPSVAGDAPVTATDSAADDIDKYLEALASPPPKLSAAQSPKPLSEPLPSLPQVLTPDLAESVQGEAEQATTVPTPPERNFQSVSTAPQAEAMPQSAACTAQQAEKNIAAFCKGAGIQGSALNAVDSKILFQNLGAFIAQCSDDLITRLNTQNSTQIKHGAEGVGLPASWLYSVLSESTPSAGRALVQFLSSASDEEMQMFFDACSDLSQQERLLIDGLSNCLQEIAERNAPKRIESSGHVTKKVLPLAKKAALWDAYCALYDADPDYIKCLQKYLKSKP